MSERDRFDEMADGCWDDLILYAKGGASETTQKRRLAAFLRDAHARGLAEGVAAERQRCAEVCEANQKRWQEAARQPDLIDTEWWPRLAEGARLCHADILAADSEDQPAAQPHGPPVTADPGEGKCGTCALWHRPEGCDFGFCKVARTVTNRGPDCPGLGTLHQTTADHACDVGAWRGALRPPG